MMDMRGVGVYLPPPPLMPLTRNVNGKCKTHHIHHIHHIACNHAACRPIPISYIYHIYIILYILY